MDAARERKQHFLSKPQRNHHTLLVPPTESNDWNNNTGKYGKKNLLSILTVTQSSRRDTHTDQMRRYLKYSSLDRALYPQNKSDGAKFNVPILDMLAVEGKKEYGCKYPSEETILTYQDYRGLSTSMLRHCKTEEPDGKGAEIDHMVVSRVSNATGFLGGANLRIICATKINCTQFRIFRITSFAPKFAQ